jgi:hypothetical protein
LSRVKGVLNKFSMHFFLELFSLSRKYLKLSTVPKRHHPDSPPDAAYHDTRTLKAIYPLLKSGNQAPIIRREF